MAAKKKTKKAETPAAPTAEGPTPAEGSPPDLQALADAAAAQSPSPEEALAQDPGEHRLLLEEAQHVLWELMASSNIGTISRWEFARKRAHRPDACSVSNLAQRLEKVLGPYEPIGDEASRSGRSRGGVRYMNQ